MESPESIEGREAITRHDAERLEPLERHDATERRDAFSDYHPLVELVYFVLVLVFSAAFLHPVCLGLSLAVAISYALYLSGGRVGRSWLPVSFLVLFTALLNPAFNHQGVTVLTYLPGGNPLTRESIFFGLAAGSMLAAVLCWFYCYNRVMTTDKFVYLFGRVIPALALVLSMTLRFGPRFRVQLNAVISAQRALGREMGGGLTHKIRAGLTVISIMTTWALENAVETADSMRCRGYGLPHRTTFSIYRWQRRDSGAMLFLLAASAFIITVKARGLFYWRFFPLTDGTLFTPWAWGVYIVYLALLSLPLAINITEDRRWMRLRSKI